MVSINFAVALFALLGKRKKETLKELTPLRSDVTKQWRELFECFFLSLAQERKECHCKIY